MIKQNLSTKFLLPFIGGKSYKETRDIKNVYIKDTVKGNEYQNHLFCLVDRRDEIYEFLKARLTSYALYEIDYEYADYQMFVFRFPDEYDYVIDLFKEGMYSHFPEEYKSRILRYYSGKNSKIPILSYIAETDKLNSYNFIEFSSYIKNVLYPSDLLYERYDNLLEMNFPRTVELCKVPEENEEVFSEETLKTLYETKQIDEWI